MDYTKYKPQPTIDFPQRTWPNKKITKAPKWCSVDLRDGNQSLEIPMTLEQKLDFFSFLVDIGFKEIEVGFPAASDTEFQFLRTLIEKKLIPNDVIIQVLTPSRDALIRRTFEALSDVPKGIVHLYNATSPLHRDVVFQKSQAETTELAVSGAELINELATEYGRDRFIFEYSPECFSQTEPDYAIKVCNAVIDCWKGHPTIINLPFTVETAMPNAHADIVEYVIERLNDRENIVVSLHAHNDRGTAVAATELCLLAGADRVEGTLFGNGERTGNADLITLAMNLYAQGIDPCLDFSNIDRAIDVYTKYTDLPVHPRHPYAGELVYTAFSGSHQDAIRKGMARMSQDQTNEKGQLWSMPYLPIDPKDVGRSYDPIIRINSQSGAAASAFILESNYGILIPKPIQRNFGLVVTAVSDSRGTDLSPKDIHELFKTTYVNKDTPAKLITWNETQVKDQVQDQEKSEIIHVSGEIMWKESTVKINGQGDGIIEAFCHGFMEVTGIHFDIKHYSQHALESGREARAITYVGIAVDEKEISYGVGISRNITTSSLKAVISAFNNKV